ncbi:hypothetical protein Nepgr_016616 [Nepenthes gracilis]|uniref:Uncharacterized protein n=1 Tax=Nepenthes gracilis TaxID=150966 RepID=A0AAD3XSN2_NEPGR|nr:hypothetical protein Nepgr_016616 [Nepenthes gracilis]
MRSCKARGKELIDASVITMADLSEWLKAKNGDETAIIGGGLPSCSSLQNIRQVVLSGNNTRLMEAWENWRFDASGSSSSSTDSRLTGMMRSISKFPICRRKYNHIVKTLIA